MTRVSAMRNAMIAFFAAVLCVFPAFAAQQTIPPSDRSPALYWSRVNANFTELYATAGLTKPYTISAYAISEARRWSQIKAMVTELAAASGASATFPSGIERRNASFKAQAFNSVFTSLYTFTGQTLIATKALIPGQLALSTNTVMTSGGNPLWSFGLLTDTSRTYHAVGQNGAKAGTIRVVYPGWAVTESADTATGNPVTVRASLEIAGVAYPVTFSSASQGTITSGGNLVSDPVAGTPDLAAGTEIWFTNRADVTSTSLHFPMGRSMSGNARPSGAAEVNLRLGSTPTADVVNGTGTARFNNATQGYVFGPAAIVGVSLDNTKKTVFAFTDSIGSGAGDTPIATGEVGFIQTWASGKGFSYVCACKQAMSATASVPATAGASRFALAAIARPNVVVVALGTNDARGLTTGDIVKSAMLKIWVAAKALTPSTAVYQTTIVPISAGTSSLESNASAKNAAGILLNTWLRDNAPAQDIGGGVLYPSLVGQTGANTFRIGDPRHPLTGIIDTAAAVSDGSGNWGPGLEPADGVHPTAAGHALMKAVMDAYGPIGFNLLPRIPANDNDAEYRLAA